MYLVARKPAHRMDGTPTPIAYLMAEPKLLIMLTESIDKAMRFDKKRATEIARNLGTRYYIEQIKEG